MSDESSPAPAPTPARPGRKREDALPPGTRFGEFEVLGVIGAGGFGIVYLAQDHSLERQVALKEYMPSSLASRGEGHHVTLRSGASEDTYAAGLRSFVNEARLLARFDHPALVKVYRFWEDNATAYMVMPYLQGTTLRDARRAMARPPDERWIRGVLDAMLDALEQLHRADVYHRDIAPDNILLPREGVPILLDFGAARRVISDRTQSLTAILKPSYAPIEQYAEMNAMRQGPWTDFYALGAVLHFLLFGAPPAPSTARAVQPDDDPIAGRTVPGVSARFLAVVAWMLSVRPTDRPRSVAEIRDALEGRIDPPPAPTPPAPAAAPVQGRPPGPYPSMAGYEPTMRVAGPYSEPTRRATAYAPTERVAPPAPLDAPSRSAEPPAAPAAARQAPSSPRPSQPSARPRRGLLVPAVGLLTILAAIAWWLSTSRPPAVPSGPVGATAAPAAGYTGPSLSEVTRVPQWGAAASAASAPR